MATLAPQGPRRQNPILQWFLQGHVPEPEGPHTTEQTAHTHPWWKVMCLTGVDYFSTLGYQPGIAALAAGALSPFATLVLVLLTLFGALPMYKRVAHESPHGDGSISMLEGLLTWWKGKLFILCLIGFAATGFIVTITLSAADATAHIIENPFVMHYVEGREVPITLLLIGLLGAVFLKGFNEAIGIAIGIVAVYLSLNAVVIGLGLYDIFTHPHYFTDWKALLFKDFGNPLNMIKESLLVFPYLALGLSGFETGVVVMPLIKGDTTDDPERPFGRIRNARKLLALAAGIMSVYLISSSIVSTFLIPPNEFHGPENGGEPGKAYGRALAYLAHERLGDGFGTVYDLSTIAILWFAGASAMAGLLNIVPRYLPRYGMAPEWTRATRPLALIFTLIAFAVTIYFKAGVEAQAGAYATGVLALMTSATIAVTLSAYRKREKWATIGFGFVTLVFLYTTGITLWEKPEGLQIAGVFIALIVGVSLLSRLYRTTELRVDSIEMDATARQFIQEIARGEIHIIANHPQRRDEEEYRLKEKEQREDNHIPRGAKLLFLEVTVGDASDFSNQICVEGEEKFGYRILRVQGSNVPNTIAALLLHIRDLTGKIPHAYFSWTEGNPLLYILKYIAFGAGDIAPVTREVLRQNEPDPDKRPAIHVGG